MSIWFTLLKFTSFWFKFSCLHNYGSSILVFYLLWIHNFPWFTQWTSGFSFKRLNSLYPGANSCSRSYTIEHGLESLQDRSSSYEISKIMYDLKKFKESWRLTTRSWKFFLKNHASIRFSKKKIQDVVDNHQDYLYFLRSYEIFEIS